MFNRKAVLWGIYGSFLILSGCICSEEPMPRITYEEPSVPKIRAPKQASTGWKAKSVGERNWTAIIIHHSATKYGNSAIFDGWHKDKGWDGVGYDFVIGNGTNSGDGVVEETFRWREQREGAHTGGTPNNWANEEGIGICLVGDFNQKGPTKKQMDALVNLVRPLQKKYGISKSRVFGHGTTPGRGHDTDCPGNNFPMSKFKSMLY